MAASNLTSVSYIYKRKYNEAQVVQVAMRDHPTFFDIAKMGGFSGASFHYGITYAFPQGISGTFADAQAGAESSKGVQLQTFRKPKFAVITLNGEAMAACDTDGALLNLVTKETNGKLSEMGANFAFDLFGVGNGVRGQRTAASTNVITLANRYDCRNFKVGMTVIASANLDGSSPRAGSTKVAAIDESNSQITLVSAAGITSFANSDYLFRKGDPGTCMEGMEACTPLTAPTAGDSFRGIDRSVDPSLLSGSRVLSSGAIDEDMGLCAVKIGANGKRVKKGAINPINFWTLVKRAQAKVEYQGAGGTADYGFEYINLNTSGGTVKVYSDPDCPIDRARLFNPEAHFLKHLQGLPHLIKTNNEVQMQLAAEDGIEIRGRGWVNYVQEDTAAHGVVQIS